jgi:hypothetical protein
MVRGRSQQDLKQELIFKVEAPTLVIIGTLAQTTFVLIFHFFCFLKNTRGFKTYTQVKLWIYKFVELVLGLEEIVID